MNLLKSWTVPIEIFNESSGKYANQYWRAKNARHKRQKEAVKSYLNALRKFEGMSVKIKIVRISPRKLDEEDNLRYSCKWAKDALAELLIPGLQTGRADGSNLIEWHYGQEKGSPKQKGMRVEVYESNT